MKPRARNCLLLAMLLFSATKALAAWWVIMPDAAVKHGGYRKQQGPFATKADAEAYWRGERLSGPANIVSDGADAQQQKPNQSEGWRQVPEVDRQREAEERVAVEKKAAEEQAARDKAARDAEEARRFQQNRNEALKQLKGFNQESDLKLKGVSGGGVSGLKEAPKPTAAAVNTDAMVVDFRNLTSGLPKSVDEAIPHTPAGNRIRKGFQAIAKHDWENALLWFKDAYNREPGDPGLQRLVELAQYTLDSQAKLLRQPAGRPVTSGQAAQLPAQDPPGPVSELKQVTSNETPYTRSNFIARVAAGNMAAEARVQEVYAELRRKYGPEIPFRVRYSLETNTKIQQARDGEGLSKEELNSQLEAALTEFLKTHKTYSSSVGGSAAAEEVTLGGKG